jgi:hypothetical protein
MKYCLFFTLFFVSICSASFANNYYFSNSGNDNNNGLTTTSAFQSIDKLNTLISLNAIVSGDTVFFKCGDVFRGQINITVSGTSLSPIVFTSYGNGNKPVISGAEPITNWTLNGNRYEANFSQAVTNFFVNDREQTLARYPNDHQYLTLDSAQLSYLKDASAASISSSLITNSRICIHTAQWCWEKTNVASVTADKINYSSPLALVALAQYGYFLYDNINHLDTANEWKYTGSTQVMSYIPSGGQNPNSLTCEAAVYSNGIQISGSSSYIVINNLSFEKQANAGVLISSSSNKYIKVNDCYFARQYNHGINDKGKYNEIYNCYFREIDGIALYVSNTGGSSTIHHNTFRSIGQFRNSGIGTQINGSAVTIGFVDSCLVHHNDIDSAGYCGISADGGYHLVEKNIIKNAMMLNNDGAALKSFGALSHHITFRNNFVTSSDGNNEGTFNPNFITPAIYFDFNVNNCTVQDNTVYGRTQKGIFQNAGDVNNNIIGNIIYGTNYALDMNGHPNQNTADTMNGYVIKKNVFWLKNSNDYIMRQVDFINTFKYGLVDSNYYFQPYSTRFAIRPILGGGSSSNLSLTAWRAEGNDINTKTNNFTWAAGVDSSAIFTNPTDNAVVQNLQGFQWMDLDGNIVTNLSLQPWTSKVLIRTSSPLLPVSVTSFTATKQNDDIKCTWQTVNEINVNNYNLQRSNDGISFSTIGILDATGNNSYSYLDLKAANIKTSVLYYRLLITDNDGKKTYSSIVAVKLNDNTYPIKIYPNPASAIVFVNATNVKSICIFNSNGQLLITKNSSETVTSINVSTLSRGIYTIKIIDNSGTINCKQLVIE